MCLRELHFCTEKVFSRLQAEVVGKVPGTDFAAGLGPLRREPALGELRPSSWRWGGSREPGTWARLEELTI